MEYGNIRRAVIAGCVSTLALTSCGGTDELSSQYPSASASLATLDADIAAALDDNPLLDELRAMDDPAAMQQRIAQHYVEARIDGVDPIVAEAQFAGLYDEATLAQRAAAWVQIENDPTQYADFITDAGMNDEHTVSYQITTDSTVLVEWHGPAEEQCVSYDKVLQQEVQAQHWASVGIGITTSDTGEPVIAEFHHSPGCGCSGCTVA